MATLLDIKRHAIGGTSAGAIEASGPLHPPHATSDLSLLLRAADNAEYQPLIPAAVAAANCESAAEALDRVLVASDREILRHIDGRVATDVDARLSFDADTIRKARHDVSPYDGQGLARTRETPAESIRPSTADAPTMEGAPGAGTARC